ncbi:helix-turn-helix transcriptional regulator [Ottowia thiooxydans]|uniref:DNA-binding transcriptional regulator AlpA n=1 Tax=Ottowia thiooxydans TaxID=219182 RepID=A0ABV2Q6V3_9BURK
MAIATKKNVADQMLAAMNCPAAHLRIATVELMVGRKRAWLYKSAADGSFPRPVARGRWRAGDVLMWLSRGEPNALEVTSTHQ